LDLALKNLSGTSPRAYFIRASLVKKKKVL